MWGVGGVCNQSTHLSGKPWALVSSPRSTMSASHSACAHASAVSTTVHRHGGRDAWVESACIASPQPISQPIHPSIANEGRRKATQTQCKSARHLQAVLRRGLLVQMWPFLGCPQRPHL